MKKMLLTALIAVLVFGVFETFSGSANLIAQDTKVSGQPAKVKENPKTKKLTEKELKKKKRAERLAKRKKSQGKTRYDRFFPMPKQKLAKLLETNKSAKTLDHKFGDLILLKNMFVYKSKEGVSTITVVIDLLENRRSMYDFQIKFMDKNGKEVNKISSPIIPYGRNMKKNITLVAQFKIDEWVGKYDHFDVSIEVPVEPVLKVGDKTSVTVK